MKHYRIIKWLGLVIVFLGPIGVLLLCGFKWYTFAPCPIGVLVYALGWEVQLLFLKKEFQKKLDKADKLIAELENKK